MDDSIPLHASLQYDVAITRKHYCKPWPGAAIHANRLSLDMVVVQHERGIRPFFGSSKHDRLSSILITRCEHVMSKCLNTKSTTHPAAGQSQKDSADCAVLTFAIAQYCCLLTI